MYKRLNFEDYFVICSENFPKIATDLKIASYNFITYKHKNHEHTVGYEVRYDEARNCIQVILQQTVEKTDWLTNFNFPAKLYDKIDFEGKQVQLKVHRGWANMWLACQQAVRVKVAELLEKYPNSYIEVFGWSLGSALASLAAEDIYFKFKKKPYLYTFGSVKPFFGKATHEYINSCCEEAYNFYDHCDVVGYMVPFWGYKAINHLKVKLDEKFNLKKLFSPGVYHTNYHHSYLYTTYNEK